MKIICRKCNDLLFELNPGAWAGIWINGTMILQCHSCGYQDKYIYSIKKDQK